VSEAFYLQDPDGLGIEVYADRPRSTWRRTGRQLMMATDPVDVASLVREAGDLPWEGMPAGTTMGTSTCTSATWRAPTRSTPRGSGSIGW
jgi:catechol 2,3-dioxygenase